MTNINKAIQQARHHKGISQAELSRTTGIHQTAISRMENGRATPTIETFLKIAKGLNAEFVVKRGDVYYEGN